jgi:hypothetical protein
MSIAHAKPLAYADEEQFTGRGSLLATRYVVQQTLTFDCTSPSFAFSLPCSSRSLRTL